MIIKSFQNMIILDRHRNDAQQFDFHCLCLNFSHQPFCVRYLPRIPCLLYVISRFKFSIFMQALLIRLFMSWLKRDFLLKEIFFHKMLLQYNFQQDGAPPHFQKDERSFLDVNLPNRWIGRRGYFEFPLRSPDVTPLDFFFWGYIKDLQPSSTWERQLKRKAPKYQLQWIVLLLIRYHCLSRLSSRYHQCLDQNGHQFEPL